MAKQHKQTKKYKRCWESHQHLKFEAYGKSIEIAGGTCYSGGHGESYDIEVALDRGAAVDIRAFPWNHKMGLFIEFPITDGRAPADVEEFHKMVVWLTSRLRKGKTLHIGCIGGHGRTGTLLAALYAHMTKDSKAITYVRENYCPKSVESAEQVDFLAKHYGCDMVKGSTTYTKSKVTSGWQKYCIQRSIYDSYTSPWEQSQGLGKTNDGFYLITPVEIEGCILGSNTVTKLT